MTLDTDVLRTLLCEEVRVEARPDGALMVRTHFAFPDGDRYPFHLSEAEAAGLRLSDRGHTLDAHQLRPRRGRVHGRDAGDDSGAHHG